MKLFLALQKRRPSYIDGNVSIAFVWAADDEDALEKAALGKSRKPLPSDTEEYEVESDEDSWNRPAPTKTRRISTMEYERRLDKFETHLRERRQGISVFAEGEFGVVVELPTDYDDN